MNLHMPRAPSSSRSGFSIAQWLCCSLFVPFTTSIIDNHIQTTKVIVCLLYRPLHGGFIAIHLCIPVCNLAIQKTLPYFKSTELV